MNVFIVQQTYEDGDGWEHQRLVGVFATRAGADAAVLGEWRLTRLRNVDVEVSHQPECDAAIKVSRRAFNDRVLTGEAEGFLIEETSLGP